MINVGNSMNESLDSGYFIEYLYGDAEQEERTRTNLVVSAKDEKEAINKAKKYLDKKYNNSTTYKRVSQVQIDRSRGTKGKCDSIKNWKKRFPNSNFEIINESKGMDSKEESLIKKQLKNEGFSDEDIKIIISAMSRALSESASTMNESLTNELKSLSKAGLMVTCDDGKPFFSKMDRLISDLIRNKQIKSVDDIDNAKIEEIDAKTTKITTKSGTQFVISKMN